MLYSRHGHRPHASRRAAILVDYANLYRLLTQRLAPSEQADTYITEAIAELRRYLSDEDDTSTVLTAAYADFNALAPERALQEPLYCQGIETRFVPETPDASTVEVQLSVDATALFHQRPDVKTFVLMSGDRPFFPLVQALQREGVQAFVAALDPPPPGELGHTDGDVFMDFHNLLSEAGRRALARSGGSVSHGNDAQSTSQNAETERESLESETLTRTLEIAEEHFGQYDEIYLTPLLRKISDILGEGFDPKALVSDLEDAGAVHLEKRRGYPYDYTVLIVDRDHPDVQQVTEDFYNGNRSHPEDAETPPSDPSSHEETYGYADYDDYDDPSASTFDSDDTKTYS